MKVNVKSYLAYTMTPQIIPRLHDLIGSGFGHIAFFIALVCNAVGLLPNNHAYTQPRNIGNFSIRHVLTETASRLTWRLAYSDQILLFALIVIGLVIGAVHIFLLLLTLLTNPSLAQDGFTFSKLFAPPNPEHDLAYMMMDLVFGIENVFNSCVTTDSCTNTSGQSVALFELSAENRWPFTVHEALHSMLGFYSTGLLLSVSL